MFEMKATAAGQPLDLRAREKLNLGCGLRHLPDAVNLDITPATNPDIVHDLNRLPWPFPDNHFREAQAFDVIEHLEDFIAVMEELHRVCRAGAIVSITVPHFSCANAFTDPTHRRQFGYFSMDYVTGDNDIQFYTKARFKKLSSRMMFYPSLLNKLVWRLANRYPAAYERRWAWMFPAWYLHFKLETLKDE
ncbi:MAG TPA: methyltransferase domain-containing protein [Pyrinomonadaceae bacterium]|jgi:SAM-dependent methyltransferase